MIPTPPVEITLPLETPPTTKNSVPPEQSPTIPVNADAFPMEMQLAEPSVSPLSPSSSGCIANEVYDSKSNKPLRKSSRIKRKPLWLNDYME